MTMTTHLIALDPLDSFFFPDHRPFNQDDEGLDEAQTRFPPPPHAMAGAIRFAIARKLGWDEGTEDWSGKLVNGIDLGAQLGSGPFKSGNLRFGPPLLLLDDQPLYPVPRILLGRFGRVNGRDALVQLALVRPGDDAIATDAHPSLQRLPVVDAERPHELKPLSGWWLTKSALERLLQGALPSTQGLHSPSDLMRTAVRVGLQTDYARHRNRDGMLYAAAHGAFVGGKRRLRFACRLAIMDGSRLSEGHLPDGLVIPFGSHGRAAEVGHGTHQGPPRMRRHGRTTLRYFVSLLSPAWLTGGPVPREIKDLPGTLVSAVHDRPLLLGAWDRGDPQKRRYQRLYPTGSTWFLEAVGEEKARAHEQEERLLKPGEGIGAHTEVGFGAAVVGTWGEKKKK